MLPLTSGAHSCRAGTSLFLSSRFHLPPHHMTPVPGALCCRTQKRMGLCSSRDRQRFIWRDGWGERWSRLLRIQSPHLSGSTWQHFWAILLGERYAGVFLFFPTSRCIKLSRAKQQTDGGVRRTKRKMFCSGPSCAFRRDVFAAKVFKQSGCFAFFFLAKQSVVFVSVELSLPKPSGNGGKTFQIYDIEHNRNTRMCSLKMNFNNACLCSTNSST